MADKEKPAHIKQEQLLFFEEMSLAERQHWQVHMKECITCAEKFKEFTQIDTALRKMKSLHHVASDLLCRYVTSRSSEPEIPLQKPLTLDEVAAVEKHLKQCPLCEVEYHILAREYADLGTYFDNISIETPLREHNDALGLDKDMRSEDERVKWHDLKKTLAALKILGLFALLSNYYRKKPARNLLIGFLFLIPMVFLFKFLFISEPSYPPGPLLAYQEINYLEELLADRDRSHSITVSSPVNNTNFKITSLNQDVEILFTGFVQASQLKLNDNLRLKIFNNKKEDYVNDSAVFTELLDLEPEVNIYRFKENIPVQLSPGLYYFTLNIHDKLLYVGKFFVNKPKM